MGVGGADVRDGSRGGRRAAGAARVVGNEVPCRSCRRTRMMCARRGGSVIPDHPRRDEGVPETKGGAGRGLGAPAVGRTQFFGRITVCKHSMLTLSVSCAEMFATAQKTQELWMWKMEYLHHEQRPLYFGEWF